MHYEIRVEWDAEASVWYIEGSNVPGLVAEAATLEDRFSLLVPERTYGLQMHDSRRSALRLGFGRLCRESRETN